jgi:hypothetical protein
MTDSNIEARLSHLEKVFENFVYILEKANVSPSMPLAEAIQGMPSITSQASPDPTVERHIVIPDGWEMPSSDLSVAQQQYADALFALERVSRALNNTMASFSTLTIRPPKLDLAMVFGLPLMHELAAEMEENLSSECLTCRPTVSRELAIALVTFVKTSGGADVAASEFSEWAWNILGRRIQEGDEVASRLYANLKATGLVGEQV